MPLAATTERADLRGLAGALERLTAVVRRLPAPGGLSLATAGTLNTLSRYGPARLTDLAHSEAVSQPAMTQLVSRLERDRLAERRADLQDGRVVRVSITPAGEQLLAGRRAARADQITELVDRLEPDEREAVAAALPALVRLAEMGERARAEQHDVPRGRTR